MTSGGNGDCSGPTAGEPVNLATGEEEYKPAPDMIVQCPISGSGPRNTPSVVWSRIYNSLRELDPSGLTSGNNVQYYESADFGVGWSHSYNVRIYDPTGSGGFQTGTKWLILPNGARIAINATVAPNPTYGSPGVCTVGLGVPYNVQWTAGGAFIVTQPNRMIWTFQRLATNPQGYTDYNQYLLSSLADRDGHALQFAYNNGLLSNIGGGGSFPLLTIYRNADGSIEQVSDLYGHTVYYHETAVTNTTPSYAPGPANHIWLELTNVSRVISDGSSTPFPTPGGNTFNASSRWCYGYTQVATGDTGGGVNQAFAFLSTIQVPSPAVPTSTAAFSQATISYQSGTCAVSQVTDANNIQTRISNPSGSNNYLTTVNTVQPVGGSLVTMKSQTFGFDSSMRQSSVTDYNGSVIVQYGYADPNDPNQPSSMTDANNNAWSFAWDAYGNLHQSTDPRGVVTKYTWAYRSGYSPGGATGADVQAANAPYLGELRSVKEESRTATSFDYWEPSGHVYHVYSPKPDTTGTSTTNGPTVTTTYAYDTYETGNLISVTTPGNNATVVNGVDQGITTSFTYQTDATYDQYGNPSSSGYTAPETRFGLPLTMTEATTDGSTARVSHFRYDSEGHLVVAVDASGNKTTFSYVLQNSPNSSVLSDQIQQVTFPATGQTGSGQGYTKYAYQYDGGPLTGKTVYDESGYAVNGNGTGGVAVRQIGYSYGPEGELRSLSGSTEPVQYVYDGLYRLSALTDGNGHSTNYYYNAAGHLDSLTYPGYTGAAFPNVGGPDSMRFVYDAAGNLTKRFDGNGAETDYQRVIPGTSTNEPGSLVRTVHYPGGGTADVGLSYDAYGRLSVMTDGSGSMGYAYDDLDATSAARTAYTGVPAQVMQYYHYNDGSRWQMVIPARTYTYTYDKAGRLVQLSNDVGESTGWGYQVNNWLTAQVDYNGLQTQAVYNPLGQLTDLQNSSSASGLLSEFGSQTQSSGIRHDGAGDIASVPVSEPASSSLSGTTSYTYDYGQTGGRSQLTQENSTRSGGFGEAFGYDVAGNPISLRGVSAPYNADNQATTPSGNNPAFASDGNGNPAAARGHALAFDPENRLTGAADLAAGVATAIGVGPDNVLRQFYNNNDGSISIVNINLSDGSRGQVYHPYGAIPDWTCTALAVGADSQPRVLWNRSDGQMSVWTVAANGSVTSTPGYGPYPGLTCTRLAVGPDNKPRVLWVNASGQVSIWTINNDGSIASTPGYGPIAGWSCMGLAVGPDNLTRVLWVHTSDGQVSIWTINSDGSYSSTPGYGPIAGWSCTGLAVGLDNLTRVLWVHNGDHIFSMWTLHTDGSIASTSAIAPSAGYVPVGLAMDGYGVGRLLMSDSLGGSQIVDLLPDNTTSGVLETTPVSHTAGTGEASAYRGDGLRGWKQTDSGARTYYLYDGSQPVCELNSSGSVTAINTFGATGLISRNVTGYGNTLYAFDERGNVAHRTYQDGHLVNSDLYDAYGKQRAGGSDVFGFGGQAGYYTDTETGLILCTNRFYDPQTGRFLTRDPMGYGGGINLYGYVGNNPANGMDPLGLMNPDGSPDTMDAIRSGLNVGFKATAHAFTFGAYDGGDAKCDPDFGTSAALAGVGRDALITAATLGAGEGVVGVERGAQAAEEGSEAAEGVGSSCFKCFTAETPVQMADGTTKPISEVRAGDRVRSRDPQTGKESARTVTATIKRLALSVVTVSLTDAKTGKLEALTCTPEHPLYVTGQGWVEAGSLGIGSSIVSRAGPAMTVAGVTWHRHAGAEKVAGSGSGAGLFTVYNLTVEDDHTYFVGAADGGTWVHNNSCPYYLKGKSFPSSIDEMDEMVAPRGINTGSGRKWNLPDGYTLKAEAHGPEYNGYVRPGHGDLHFHIEDPAGIRLPSGNPDNPRAFYPGQIIPTEW